MAMKNFITILLYFFWASIPWRFKACCHDVTQILVYRPKPNQPFFFGSS